MTAVIAPPADPTAWTIGSPRLLTGLDRHTTLDLAAHVGHHGVRPGVDAARLLALLDAARLTGRGGAGFPLAQKLRALRGSHPTVVVNGVESEPCSGKDRTLLIRTPHLVLDGALSVADAVGAARVVVAMHDAAAAVAVQRAIAERADARCARVAVIGSGFVAGESRTLVRALSGGPVLPPGRPNLPTAHGFLVSNAETLAQTALLVRLGARGFADTGTVDEPGTVLLSIGGAVERPGVVEVPLGTPLPIVLAAARAQDSQYLVVGGYNGTWLGVDSQAPVSRAGLAAAGATLGAGVIRVLDGARCALGELSVVASWLAHQSTRQCGPCTYGLPALAADVAALGGGDPGAARVAARHAALVTGRGACAHPDGAARFVRSGLARLTDEIARHGSGGCGRSVLGRLPVGARP
jgi:NADH:ubiquinone oxidoreductase subunit F (NADH-binding)